MRDTNYATELKTAEDGFGQRIERLYVKKMAREEIRFSWWKDGQLMIRPLDLPEQELLPLFQTAVSNQVFSENFLRGLHAAVAAHLSKMDYERSVERLEMDKNRLADTLKTTENLIAYLETLDPIDEEWPEIDDPPPEPVRL